MTKKAFQYDMQRGLGSCVVALRDMTEAEREKFQPVVLWGCARDLAYDAQCEGSRSVYLYELIAEFSDVTPFIDVIEKRLFRCMRSSGWEFSQDCQLLAHFVSDGIRRAWHILRRCYDQLFAILSEKRGCAEYGRMPERDSFESLCVSLVSQCFEDREPRSKLYRMAARDLGFLAEGNEWFDAGDFYWFQTVCEDCLGKKMVHRLLHRADADVYTMTYARLMETYQDTWEQECGKLRRKEPETADEIYDRLRNGEALREICNSLRVQGFMVKNKEQEALKIAAYYQYEQSEEIRASLLRLLANRACAWTIDLARLIGDSKSGHLELSKWAFEALGYRTDARVRAYALELLQSGRHIGDAVSMLAANYEDQDKELFVNAVKQLPITYEEGEWHGVFHDVMDLFGEPGGKKPKELLPYMYQNTLCSFCREYVVREMGRRRMLTRKLLEEMQYDCNEEIRKYADRKLSRMGIRKEN